MRPRQWCLLPLSLALLSVAGPARAADVEPLAELPPWMRVILPWGQRPEWEREGRGLLFMEKAFGDAYRLDVETGAITPLTTHFFHDGFDRILALPNGDTCSRGRGTSRRRTHGRPATGSRCSSWTGA